MDVLKDVAIKALAFGHSTEPPPSYLRLFRDSLETGHPYYFVHFHGFPTAFVRLNNEHPGDETFVLHQRPFKKLPIIQANLHPYTAILDVAQRVMEHQEKKIPVNSQESFQPQLDLCVVIYKQWLSLRPTPKLDREPLSPLAPASAEKSQSRPVRPSTANNRRLKRVLDPSSDEGEFYRAQPIPRAKRNTPASKE